MASTNFEPVFPRAFINEPCQVCTRPTTLTEPVPHKFTSGQFANQHIITCLTYGELHLFTRHYGFAFASGTNVDMTYYSTVCYWLYNYMSVLGVGEVAQLAKALGW